MLEWNEYVEQLLTRESSFDGVKLSIGDTHETIGVPPMIKASILMLDRMMECQGKNNILVFPERIQSIFIFTLVKLLYNISEGRIERAYNPESFIPGEKLRFGKAVVEFVRVEEKDNEKYIRIRLADLEYSAPITYVPLFQKTTAQRTSKYKQFVEAKREAVKLLPSMTDDEKYLKLLADYKTHMDSSIVNMTSIINTKAMFSDCKLCGRSVKDAILVGQADYEGTVKNIGAGQLGGTPAIVLASDLYSISAMAQKRHPIQSIIIDASNTNAMLSQMDALDDLMRLGVPITCVTDIANSFDLRQFSDRGFNIWRWDETSITEKLYDANPLTSDLKNKHCATKKVEYKVSDGKEISTAIKKISAHKSDTQAFSAQMLRLFDKLYSISVSALQETVPYDEGQLSQNRTVLEECDSILHAEKDYLAPKVYEDFKEIISSLKCVFAKSYLLPKNDALKNLLQIGKYYSDRNLCLIIPDRADKKRVESYWQNYCTEQQQKTSICVMYPAEFCSNQHQHFSRVIISGWLKRAVMRKVLFSFNANDYVILLYDYEKRWKNFDTARWNQALSSAHNRQTIEKSFATEKLHISTSRFEPKQQEAETPPKDDEFTELEAVIRENKYRQYVAGGGKKAADETVEAIPINYVGNYLAFYRTGHKVISASNIIINDDDKIELILPDQLKLGDFVVVREADHDLIKELADRILERSGKTGTRELATKWKEALEIEQLFSTEEDIYQRLLGVGFTKGFPTVHRWLSDDDVIAPQSKQDLEHIATITGSAVLKEMLEQIFDAAQTVRSAHVQAGRVLSEKLRSRIVESLNEYGDIDPFNIWEPIEMQIEGIGMVRILKIIDIGAPVTVDITDTNRLIEE